MDDGHQGVDFAYWSRGPHKTMLGLPIYAAISGRVAVILKDRYPYGNAVIIETPLEQLPAAWLDKMVLPTPAPVAAPSTRLTCPTPEVAPIWDQNHQSLYLLYAHMDQLPQVKVGDQVICGQQIGVVGTTGYSSNPHLHFETRIGPSGAIFDSMAHYITDASSEEMSNYCTWRISGIFAMFDPMKLLENQP
jgi:murein DD-endopeptidase MepM/ murein hydrolase activator NlpD